MVIAALRTENSPFTRLRTDQLRAGAERPDAKPWQRLAWLSTLADVDPQAALEGLRREMDAKRPPDGAYVALLNLLIGHGSEAELDALCTRIEADGIGGPYWLPRFLSTRRTGAIDLSGVRLSLPRDTVEPRIMRGIAAGSYEWQEVAVARHILKPDNRVLELGAGVGYVACASLTRQTPAAWKSVEANPALIPIIERNRELNGVDFNLEHAAYGAFDGPMTLGLWAASLMDSDDSVSAVEVPGRDGAAAIAAYRPSLLIMDIEGAEYDILSRLDMSGIDRMLIEFHPAQVDAATHTAAFGRLIAEGYLLDTECLSQDVVLFRRP